MALPQAQLGSMPSISLGGYIPAARNDPSLLEQALMAFLGGAAGTAGNRLVDKALPDPQRVAAEKLAKDRLALDTKNVDNTYALGTERNKTDLKQIDTAKATSDADRDQKAAEEARRTMLAMQARLNDTAIAQNQYNVDAATREEGMRLRAADEARTDAARRAALEASGPERAANARLTNARADAVQYPFGKPEDRTAQLRDKLGVIPGEQPQTNLDLEELAKIQQEPNASFKDQATMLAAKNWLGMTNGPRPAPQTPAPASTPTPAAPQQQYEPHVYSPEEVEAMVRRLEELANQPY